MERNEDWLDTVALSEPGLRIAETAGREYGHKSGAFNITQSDEVSKPLAGAEVSLQ